MVDASVVNNARAGVYASMILADAGLPVSRENLVKLLKSAGCGDAEMTASVCANAMEGVDVRSVLGELSKPGMGGGSGGGAVSATTTAPVPTKDAAKNEQVEAESDASDEDYGFSFFE